MREKLKSKKLKVSYMGGSQAGVVGVLTLLSKGHAIVGAVSYFEGLTKILKHFDIPVFASTKDQGFSDGLKNSDMLVSVHGREILKEEQLKAPRLGCINVHPYLYKYKGANPVKRAFMEKNFKGSVGVHKMTMEVDGGEVIVEEFVNVEGAKTEVEIYKMLYPHYSSALLKALDAITRG